MSKAEYQAYLDVSVREYAEDKIQAGNWQPEEALERSALVAATAVLKSARSEP